ncbi:MAG: SCO1664 family protein [Anaerolineales bacterium]|nr:SCO1664 family protein [Anaerolineales bacterium]
MDKFSPITSEQLLTRLHNGEMELIGLLPWSSNYTFLVYIQDNESSITAVYKPCSGERPLWDFPHASLCKRETAAYIISQALGWPSIPPTVLRDGTHGPGSVQLFIDAFHEEHYFSLRKDDAYQETWQQIALFDVITNNADRKAGHCLLGKDGQVWAIDHGLTFHQEAKLRTVIWEYAGQMITQRCIQDLSVLSKKLEPEKPLFVALSRLLAEEEILAILNRLDVVIRTGAYPVPNSGINVPFPLV